MKETLRKIARGYVEMFLVRDGIWTPIGSVHNDICYDGMDIMAKALHGDLAINAMYLVFENDAGAADITVDAANTYATYTAAEANRSFVRISTLGDPIYSSTDATIYENNRVVFLGVTDGTSYFPAIPVTDATSVFYHTALVAAPDFTDETEDKIFSCAALSPTVTKVAGAQVGVRWTITFDLP